MKLVVGIGNPGKKYEKTRHNIGFSAIRLVAEGRDAKRPWRIREKFKSAVWTDEAVTLLEPHTFVNLTGESVRPFLKKAGLKTEDLLVLCDDVNLAFGKLRLRKSGSSGGHHGLESVIEALGTQEFARLRIGIAGEGMPDGELAPYVLGQFTRAEGSNLPKILEKARQVCESWIQSGFAGAENRLSRLQSIKEE